MTPPSRPIRIGTFATSLSQRHSAHLQRLLVARGQSALLVVLQESVTPASAQHSLAQGECDCLVYPLEELPIEIPPHYSVAVPPGRMDPRDALISRSATTWSMLAPGSLVAALGARRQAELRRIRPDLEIVAAAEPTLVESLERDRRLAAAVLPSSTLRWLGQEESIRDVLPLELVLPAAGQGAVGVLVRDPVEPWFQDIHDLRMGACAAAERGFVRQFEAETDAPISVLALWAEQGTAASGWLELTGRVVSRDGERSVDGVISEPVNGEGAAQSLGARLADDLMAQGAGELLDEMDG